MVLKGKAMMIYSKMNDLPEPETYITNHLLRWLRCNDYPIDGPGMNSWGELLTLQREPPPLLSRFWRLVRTMFWEKESDKVHLDLVSPRKIITDRLSRWVYNEGLPFWDLVCVNWDNYRNPRGVLPSPNSVSQRKRRSITKWLSDLRRKVSATSQVSEARDQEGIISYRVKRLIAFAHLVTTFVGIVASLLPIVAIIVLSKLQKKQLVLGFIALFTGLFTLGLMAFTPWGKSRIEIFTATAA
jgi:hypothetical protein